MLPARQIAGTASSGRIEDWFCFPEHSGCTLIGGEILAAYISVPRDFSKVKSKVAFNLTARQLICFGAAAVVSDTDPIYSFIKLFRIRLAVAGETLRRF